ncbi:Exonuclease domain-containing protein [Mycena sanguinolenta]|uniref:Exonuclease domain-containing protein n=1 Tax=Mycena sanguinolenta TaxID=230812 RepID=A0A8H6Y1X5_9AGAR|nr:Exonuclease domain-containing protein [Mycena sanguinolenta]
MKSRYACRVAFRNQTECPKMLAGVLRPAASSIRYHSRSLHRPRDLRKIRLNMEPRPLSYGQGPMVWVDCEMTGLDADKDKILEIAVIITNGNLDLVDEGIEYIIRTDKAILDGMDEWCTKQHGQSGLTQACLDSPHSHEEVSKAVLDYIKKWVPQRRVGILAGSSVHADRAFLAKHMPEITDWLHYRSLCLFLKHIIYDDVRLVDVSSVKELSRRWYPQLGIPKLTESNHRALDDIRGSIKELEWYRRNIFIQPAPKSD